MLPQTAQTRTTNHSLNDTHAKKDHPHITGQLTLRRSDVYNPLEQPLVYYTRSWFGAGAATAAISLLAMQRYGKPIVAGLGTLGALSLAYMTRVEPAHPILERVTLYLPTLPIELDGLRIGQITDTHLGLRHTADNLVWAGEQMQRESPELIVLTGDLVGVRSAITDLPPLLRGLSAPLGVYAVPGNHDYGEGLPDVHAALTVSHIPLLLNEHRRLRWNGVDLWLIGTDDVWRGHYDLEGALRGVPRDAFTLLLSHAPDTAGEAARHNIALQLSGHTHGGHIRFPSLGPFARPRFGTRYVIGQYQVGSMTLYVSRGLGGMPVRLFCPPEATIFTLRATRHPAIDHH